MNLREDYREMTTRILVMGEKELSRNEEKRRIYKDRTTGKRYVRSMGYLYRVNEQNEWRQDANHVLSPRR